MNRHALLLVAIFSGALVSATPEITSTVLPVAFDKKYRLNATLLRIGSVLKAQLHKVELQHWSGEHAADSTFSLCLVLSKPACSPSRPS